MEADVVLKPLMHFSNEIVMMMLMMMIRYSKSLQSLYSKSEKHYSEDVPVFCLISCLIFGDEPLHVNLCSSLLL